MKINTFIIAIIFGALLIVSCTEEDFDIEMEDENCSCTTTIKSEHGTVMSIVNSAEETPISGNCYDLNFYVIDQETGNVSSKRCY